MLTMTHSGHGLAAVLAMFLLGSGMAAAQDADLQAQAEDLQQRYEEAVSTKDWEALASLFAEDMIYSSVPGGFFEDPAEIGPFYDQIGMTALDLRSSETKRVGENLILDIGTLTATLSGEAGDMQVEGEYVSLAEVGEDGPRIRSLTGFPLRQPTEAPAE